MAENLLSVATIWEGFCALKSRAGHKILTAKVSSRNATFHEVTKVFIREGFRLYIHTVLSHPQFDSLGESDV